MFLQVEQVFIVEASVARDMFAAIVAALVGLSVLMYAAASDLFDLKLFKFDPYSSLFSGGWSYAKAKKRARITLKREGRRLRKVSRERMPEAVRRLNRDIALGALAIAIALVALLIMSL